jgi:hypothetical protein
MYYAMTRIVPTHITRFPHLRVFLYNTSFHIYYNKNNIHVNATHYSLLFSSIKPVIGTNRTGTISVFCNSPAIFLYNVSI